MQTSTRVAALLGTILCAAMFARAQGKEHEMTCDDRWHDNDRISHCEINEVSLAAVKSLGVDGGMNGGVTVKGWDRDNILVRARVETMAESDGAAKSLASQVIVHTSGGQIRAAGPQLSHRQSWSVSYEVFVPRKIDLTLKTHNGGIHIADVQGEIDFDALNGGVSLKRLAGNVHGHTTNGGLSVELAGNRWNGAQLDARTTNGGVSMSVPADYSARLETGTVNGHINVDFPVTVQGAIDRQLSVTLGSGGPLVRAVTTNGGVSIKRKST